MTSPLDGHVPIRLFARDGVRVTWCWLGEARFDEPFFVQTVERLLLDPAALVFAPETGAGPLEEAAVRGGDPSALVFHTSRCGSTLVARMLAAVSRHRVLSEPEPLDALLRLPAEVAPPERRLAWLRGLAAAWAPPPPGRLVVKLEALSALSLPALREAFPGTPRVFLYRDPVEVLASNLALGSLRAGNLAIAARCGLDPRGDDADFAARVLARILRAAIEDQRSGGTLLVRYDELPDAFFSRILAHLGLTLSPEEADAARRASGEDAKAPGRTFAAGAGAAGREPDPSTRAASERWLDGPKAELDEARRAQVARGAA